MNGADSPQKTDGKKRVAIIVIPGIGASNIKGKGLIQFKDFMTGFGPDLTRIMTQHIITSQATVRDSIVHEMLNWKPRPPEKTVPTEQEKKGWHEVGKGVYGPFMKDCEKQKGLPFEPIVFAIGYNFLCSNWISADTIIDKTSEIVKQMQQKWGDNFEGYIYVTHSMGALTARSALKKMLAGSSYRDLVSLAGKCIGVIHVAAPNLGAAEAFYRFHRGVPKQEITEPLAMVAAHILGNTGYNFSLTGCVIPAMCELLPIPKHRNQVCLSSNPSLPFPSLVDIARNSLKGYAKIDDNLRMLQENLTAAEHFHNERLGSYYHPNTAVVALTGKKTVTKIIYKGQSSQSEKFIFDEAKMMDTNGDGTVAWESQVAGVTNTKTHFREAQGGIDHAEALGSAGNGKVFPLIYELMEVLWKNRDTKLLGTGLSLDTARLFPHFSSGLTAALSDRPILLNGMKVIFDRPVSLYPVVLESKEASRNGS